MSKHSTGTTASASAVISPKVKAAGVTARLVLGGAFSAIAAIPGEAWEGPGVWAGPVGVLFGGIGLGIGAVVAAYQKGDPLRNLGGAVADMGGTGGHTSTTAPPSEPVAPTDIPQDEQAAEESEDTSEIEALEATLATLPRPGFTVGGVS